MVAPDTSNFRNVFDELLLFDIIIIIIIIM